MSTEPPTMPKLTLTFTEEERERLRATLDRVSASFRELIEALRPGLEAAAKAYREIGEQLRAAGLVDDQGQPRVAAKRPAWQSPYGPAPKRGHRG